MYKKESQKTNVVFYICGRPQKSIGSWCVVLPTLLLRLERLNVKVDDEVWMAYALRHQTNDDIWSLHRVNQHNLCSS